MKPIIGHQARWNGLARAFAKGQIPQTLLISGPPNVGKSTFVLRYAQLLLCPELQKDEQGLPAPCGVCKTCHQVSIGVHSDYSVFRPIISKTEPTVAPETLDSSLISVSGARDFVQESMRKPLLGARKVLWMHQFERCQEEAQNAMLKTLEEPPAGAFLVLTSENPRNLRATILSRCWHVPFPRVPESEIAAWLQSEFEAATLQQISDAVRSSAGRPGAAWRELTWLQSSDGQHRSRFAVASEMLRKLDKAAPVAALGFTEEAIKWGNLWWEEDAGEGVDLKKLGAKGPRTASARFLDELMIAGRALWMENLNTSEIGAARLDQMRKTRHYILRNANRQLALDVMFGRLIALRPRPSGSSVRGGG